MKKCFVCLLTAFAVFLVSSLAGRADQFDRIENSPYTYWVPAPTPAPPAAYYAGPPPPYAYGPPPPPGYYYGPPPPPSPYAFIPHFFIGFHFH